MGIFDDLKAGNEMFRKMSPEERSRLMEQAKNSKKMLEETIGGVLDEEIKKRGLVTREEVEKIIIENNKKSY